MKRDSHKISSAFIESTIKVVARDGFDKASTRNIAGECGLPDAYIYTYFNDKEDLFCQAFHKEDITLENIVLKHLPIIKQTDIDIKSRYHFLFGFMWKYLMQNPDSCRFYVQYYYSPYYQKCSAEEHAKIWQPILDTLSTEFVNEDDVKPSLRLVLNTTLSLALKTLIDGQEDNDEAANGHFEMVYKLAAPHLKKANL